ncbi:MAG: hypothetical protein KAI72_03345 [Candidatus Pacebacteria bacterium]|nr:hypothetical protein [Candidatus Paceibacterota bacterium]
MEKTIIIIVFLILFAIITVVVVFAREQGFQFRLPKKEKKDDKEEGEEKPKKESFSSSEKNNDVLVAIIYIVFIIVSLLVIGKMGYKIIDTLPAISSAFGESMKVTVKEKPEWLYCQKGKFENEEECGWRGNIYKVRNFDEYITGEKSSFKFCWDLGCTDFKRNIDSVSTGTYRNRNTREEGRYYELKEVESELYTRIYTAKVVCESCQKKSDSFIIFKK